MSTGSGDGKPSFNGAMISVDKFDRMAAPAPRPNFNAPVQDDYKYIGEQFSNPTPGGPQSSAQQPGNQSPSQQANTGQAASQQRNEAPAPQVSTFDPVLYNSKMTEARNNMQGALYNIEQNMGYERYNLQQADYDLYAATQSMDAGKEFAARQKLAGIEHNLNQYIGQQFAAQQDGQRAMHNVETQFGPNAVNTQNMRSQQNGGKIKQQQQQRGQQETHHGSNVPRGNNTYSSSSGAPGSSGSSSGSTGSSGSSGSSGGRGGNHGR